VKQVRELLSCFFQRISGATTPHRCRGLESSNNQWDCCISEEILLKEISKWSPRMILNQRFEANGFSAYTAEDIDPTISSDCAENEMMEFQ